MPELCPRFARSVQRLLLAALCAGYFFSSNFLRAATDESLDSTAAAVATPVPALPADKVVGIRIEGSTLRTPAQIIPRLRTRVGDPYDANAVGTDLTELGRIMRTARADTQTSTGGIVVVFQVSDFPKFHKLQVVGNSKLKTERIETVSKLKAGALLDETTQNGIQRSLRNEYRRIGMPQAQITLNVIDVPGQPGEADLQLMINEGEQVLIRQVILQGNSQYSAMRLRSHMETKGSWAFLKNYYDDQAFEDDLATLRQFYAMHGFFDAKVERGMFQVETTAKGQKRISPVIQITESQHYTFGTADVRGVRLFSQTEAKAPFEPLRGKLFEGEQFAEALNKLQALYQNHGLLTTEIVPDYKYNTETKTLDMTVDVHEQGRIYVGKIKVVRPALDDASETHTWFRGWYDRVAPPVKDEAIVREVLLEPGKIYNKQLEQDSLRRLARLGVFDNEKLKAYNEPTEDPGVNNVVVEANEAVTGALGAGVGFGDATGAFIYGQATEKNVGGEANVFSAQVTLGTQSSGAQVGFLDRHIGDSANSLNTSLAIGTASRPGYNATSASASTELGIPLEDNWTAYLMPRIAGVKISAQDGFKDAQERLDRVYPVATLRARFEQDTRLPVGKTPREGYLQTYSIEAGYAGGPLTRIEAARDQYFTLTDKLTYRLAASAGLMPYDRSVVPIEERYFLGGNNDMRGFKFRGAGYFDREEDKIPIGGAAKALLKNELLFPIYAPVSGVLFTDIGSLGESPLQWQVPRVSSGAGLRFDLKNVQVGLDLAVPIITQDHDQTRFFHFSLQSQF